MMKAVVIFLISLSASAANWNDLEVGHIYKLTQSFQLPQTERSGSLLDFMKGDKYILNEIVPISIPGNPLILYLFDHRNCPGRQMSTNMEMVTVQGTSPMVRVAAFLEKNCELNIYVEPRSFYKKSLFE